MREFRLGKGATVADPLDLINLLRRTSAALAAARKDIAASGHLNELRDIDTLIAVAKTETEIRVAVAVRAGPRPAVASDQEDSRG